MNDDKCGFVFDREYYFSEKNLEKDSYLRHHMDEAGWVDMNLICAFPRVKSLSDDKDNILNVGTRFVLFAIRYIELLNQLVNIQANNNVDVLSGHKEEYSNRSVRRWAEA